MDQQLPVERSLLANFSHPLHRPIPSAIMWVLGWLQQIGQLGK